jgi:hypothetical protein
MANNEIVECNMLSKVACRNTTHCSWCIGSNLKDTCIDGAHPIAMICNILFNGDACFDREHWKLLVMEYVIVIWIIIYWSDDSIFTMTLKQCLFLALFVYLYVNLARCFEWILQ